MRKTQRSAGCIYRRRYLDAHPEAACAAADQVGDRERHHIGGDYGLRTGTPQPHGSGKRVEQVLERVGRKIEMIHAEYIPHAYRAGAHHRSGLSNEGGFQLGTVDDAGKVEQN